MCFYAHSLRIQSKCTPIAFDAALPKCKPRCKHPGSPGCINTRILGAFKKCAEMRLKCVMKCSILYLATGATGALCIRCIRPLMQKCADNLAGRAHHRKDRPVQEGRRRRQEDARHHLSGAEDAREHLGRLDRVRRRTQSSWRRRSS